MNDDHSAATDTLPKIELPDFPPVTAEEIERRRALFAKTIALRDEIGPIGVPIEDLIHELRGGDERFDP